MSKRERRLKTIERRWFERFGEPPSLRTDPALMQRILDSEGAAPAETRTLVEGRPGLP